MQKYCASIGTPDCQYLMLLHQFLAREKLAKDYLEGKINGSCEAVPRPGG
jgi:hypothetical protein